MLIMDFRSPLSLTIVSIFLGGRRGRGDFRRREGVESRVEPVLDDLADELRRQEVRELRRQRVVEGGQVGAFVFLEAAGAENSAQVWLFAEWPARTIFWKLGAGTFRMP